MLPIASCTDHELEGRADRGKVFEFAREGAEESIVPQRDGLFRLKKRVLQEGGILVEEERLLCMMVPDGETGSLSFPTGIAAAYDAWIEPAPGGAVMIWVDGVLLEEDYFLIPTVPRVDAGLLGERLRHSYSSAEGAWAPMTFPPDAVVEAVDHL